MNYAERMKAKGHRLELSYHKARDCWRKTINKKDHYFAFPITREGYEDAMIEYAKIKAKVDGERPNAKEWQHHRNTFQQVQIYYDQFGIPKAEKAIAKDTDDFLEFITGTLMNANLPNAQDAMLDWCKGHDAFFHEFVIGAENLSVLGTTGYTLSNKWLDRTDKLETKTYDKEPQTISHWMEKYLERINNRGGKYIREKTAEDRHWKLLHFQRNTNQEQHINALNEEWMDRYHDILDDSKSRKGKELSKKSKSEYFKAVKMFLRWAASQRGCEYTLPQNIDSNEQSFREPKGTGRKRLQRKAMLWTPEEFNLALQNVPCPYKAYLVLMLNCGFRSIDLSELQWSDVDLDEGRITIQRHKLNQQENAPVVCYKLWQLTIDLIKECGAEGEKVFQNSKGNEVGNSIACWWKNNRDNLGLTGKRLDYLRKTGSTIIAKYDRGLDEVYLGECLNTTARIHYSFTDGEPCQHLDRAIQHLGAQFGLCDAPAKQVELTPEIIKALKKIGVAV